MNRGLRIHDSQVCQLYSAGTTKLFVLLQAQCGGDGAVLRCCPEDFGPRPSFVLNRHARAVQVRFFIFFFSRLSRMNVSLFALDWTLPFICLGCTPLIVEACA